MGSGRSLKYHQEDDICHLLGCTGGGGGIRALFCSLFEATTSILAASCPGVADLPAQIKYAMLLNASHSCDAALQSLTGLSEDRML